MKAKDLSLCILWAIAPFSEIARESDGRTLCTLLKPPSSFLMKQTFQMSQLQPVSHYANGMYKLLHGQQQRVGHDNRQQGEPAALSVSRVEKGLDGRYECDRCAKTFASREGLKVRPERYLPATQSSKTSPVPGPHQRRPFELSPVQVSAVRVPRVDVGQHQAALDLSPPGRQGTSM